VKPKPTPELIAEAQRVVPDLDELHERLGSEPESVLASALHRPRRAADAARTESGAAPDDVEVALGQPVRTAVERTADGARRAIEKIRRDGPAARLDPEEVVGTEAIILLVGRPALLIQEGKFFPPPQAWTKLEDARDAIETTIQSVGRIEVKGHPAMDWIGTGWLVADGVVMTNRHVAKEFTRQKGQKWVFEPAMTGRIDFSEEFGGGTPAEFSLTQVLGVHDELDLALFRAARSSRGKRLPPPLKLVSPRRRARKGQEVYVIGFPASDSRRNDPDEMRRIFDNIYNVKRLQPGEVKRVSGSIFEHDCSTLGGNSGSCVVDLESHEVIGLHFSGRYLEANKAVALWRLANDRLIRRAGIEFAD
jgi:V8-like Glu-specific endopeptidase